VGFKGVVVFPKTTYSRTISSKMGNSNYTIEIKNQDDIKYWLRVVDNHNFPSKYSKVNEDNWTYDNLGEYLIFHSVKTNKDDNEITPSYFLCFYNLGGRNQTDAFINTYVRYGDVVYTSFQTPEFIFELPEIWTPTEEYHQFCPYSESPVDSVDITAYEKAIANACNM
jgi:hypothetical protein